MDAIGRRLRDCRMQSEFKYHLGLLLLLLWGGGVGRFLAPPPPPSPPQEQESNLFLRMDGYLFCFCFASFSSVA